MKYTLAVPVTIGDLSNPLQVDCLELHSLSITFDPEGPVLSAVLVHQPSGWKHNVVYTDSGAVEFWARTLEKEFDAVMRGIGEKLVRDGKLPAGTLA